MLDLVRMVEGDLSPERALDLIRGRVASDLQHVVVALRRHA